jgi:hypothetical protein
VCCNRGGRHGSGADSLLLLLLLLLLLDQALLLTHTVAPLQLVLLLVVLVQFLQLPCQILRVLVHMIVSQKP